MFSKLTYPLFLVAFAHLIIELCANFLPILYPILITTMGLTYSQIGLIALAAGLGATLTQPLFGYLSDRWSPGLMTILSILWIGLLMSLVGFSWNYGVLIAIVAIASLGSAAFHPAGATLASKAGTSHRGTAMSIFSVGGNLGSAFSPLLIALGIGWLGLAGTAILIPITLLGALIFYPYLKISSRPPSSAATTSTPDKIQPQNQSQSGSAVALTLLVMAVMCRSWLQISLVTYLPEWMQSQGWSLTASGQILSILLISMSFGSLVGGPLSDRIGGWHVMLMSMVTMGIFYWLFLSSAGWLQLLWGSLIGVAIGVSFPVSIVMAQKTWPQGVGLASALVIGLGWLPGGLGASFTGFMADRTSLSIALLLLIIAPLLGLVCLLAYRAFSALPATIPERPCPMPVKVGHKLD